MLKLHTKDIELLSECTLTERIIARITTNPNLPHALRDTHILLLKDKLPSYTDHLPVQPNHRSAQPNHLPAEANHQSAQPNHLPAEANHRSAQPNHLPAEANHLHDPVHQPAIPAGFLAYFILAEDLENVALPENAGTSPPPSAQGIMPANFFQLPSHQSFMSDGDIVKFNPSNHRLSFLYRRNSNYNALLVTERCNNYCLMCSQPPKDIDDSYIVSELLTAIPLMNRDTPEIGITGGEPTLLGAQLPRLLRTLKGYLPNTSVHVLSNGRNFTDLKFTGTIAAVDHPDLMFGIPIYSDISNIHDYVVQADGAFDETIRGIINLKRYKQKVEIRVVIHKQTFERLPQLAQFIARNLTFVDHVALMGLEMMGFTKFNLDELWIDPADYQPQLKAAVETVSHARIRTSIYNHQLCLLDPYLWPFNTRSISDWKNEYMPECTPCTKRDQCGGFFSSAKLRYSDHLKAFSMT